MSELNELSVKDGWVRGMHPYMYKSGQWGRIIAIVPARGRDCWLIEWPNGDTDVWNPDDPAAGYEFSSVDPDS